jgi:hypothetical protein
MRSTDKTTAKPISAIKRNRRIFKLPMQIDGHRKALPASGKRGLEA